MTNLHSALKTTVLSNHKGDAVHYLIAQLQNGKDDFIDTLHAKLTTWSSGGFQSTDFLPLLGFVRSGCEFHQGEAFCRKVPAGLDVIGLNSAIGKSFSIFKKALSHLDKCGVFVEQLEGWGYFFGKPANGRHAASNYSCRGNGHTSSKITRMKEIEDEFFHFVFTWIEDNSDKGWTTHYRAKHMPLSEEFQSCIDFLGGFKWTLLQNSLDEQNLFHV